MSFLSLRLRRSAAIAGARAAAGAAGGVPAASARSGARQLRRSGRKAAALGRQHLDDADGKLGQAGASKPAGTCRHDRPARRSRNSSRIFSSATASAASKPEPRLAQGDLARLRLCRRSGRLHRHQQPRDRGCGRDHRHPARRYPPQGRGSRARQQDRCRRAEDKDRQEAGCRQFGATATRRGSATGCWRSATRSGSAAASAPGSCRPGSAISIPGPYDDYPADRRGDQPRQFGRPDVQHARARSSASIPRSIRRAAARSASASRSRPISRGRSPTS